MLKTTETLKGSNKFCGPAALAAIFGCTTDKAAALIRDVSRQERVTGASTNSLLYAISKHGGSWRSAWHNDKRPWQIAKGAPLTLLIVDADGTNWCGHFVVVRKGKAIDSFSRQWVPVAKHRWRNARIQSAYTVSRAPKLPKPVKPKLPTTSELLRSRQRSLARQAKDSARSAQRLIDGQQSYLTYDVMADRLARLADEIREVNVSVTQYGKTLAAKKRANAERKRAQRAAAKAAEASAYLVVKAAAGMIEELWISEGGDDGFREEAQTKPFIKAYNRSPDGKLIFANREEVEDTIWRIETGTAFYDEPLRQAALMRFAERLNGELRRLS